MRIGVSDITVLEDRTKKVEDMSDEMERDLRLPGATAIEDCLQHGVPGMIANLRLADINFWVAASDKLETGWHLLILSVCPTSADLLAPPPSLTPISHRPHPRHCHMHVCR